MIRFVPISIAALALTGCVTPGEGTDAQSAPTIDFSVGPCFGFYPDFALSVTPEGEGTLLDHTVLLYGTGISDSNTHFHDDLPIAVIGGRGAGIRGGRYVRHAEGTPLANLYVSLLDRFGVHVDSFGDSTGGLETLT